MPGEPPLDIQIRNTTKNVAIVLAKVHNLQVEVKELRSELRAFFLLFTQLLPDSDRADFAEIVRLDNLKQKSGISKERQE